MTPDKWTMSSTGDYGWWTNTRTGQVVHLDEICHCCQHMFGRHSPEGRCLADCACPDFLKLPAYIVMVRNRVALT